MELGHFLTCFGLTYPEVSSVVSPGSFCLLVCCFFFCYPQYSVMKHSVYMLHPLSFVILYFGQN